ncbi:alpha/beta hydrolase [Streptomyces otsuchiensis]|uniref:alpha/beta hydrolase n=1 Tax=Streptomyces otsuchiensis TaxID=2681388 RepID=UPI001032740E|nr:alpha/beta hydrolase [Streptomyces otsuchiensis]
MPTRTTRPRALALIAAVPLLLTVACGGESPSPDSESQDRAGAESDIPAELQRFYDQELSFEGCADYATTGDEEAILTSDESFECARMEVPLDYELPDGDTAQIALMRVPARGEPIGSLVLNGGGPGGSGLVQAAVTGPALAESPMTERFDLVGFDPRGVGASVPAVDCYSDAEAESGDSTLSYLGTVVEWTEEDTRRLAERCAEGTGGDEALASLGTRDVARDMDMLRALLGDDGLSYLGQSYGTRLGAVYAEMFPDRVRAMVLDGAVDPRQDTAGLRVGAYSAFQRSFEQMAEFCAADSDCPLGTEPDRATEEFQNLIRPLLEETVPAGDDGELDFDTATGGVVVGLYSEEAWPAVIQGIAELKNDGRGDTLRALVNSFGGRAADGRWNNFSEANFAINCMDEDRKTPAEAADLRAAVFDAAPFMDPGTDLSDGSRDGCEFWPAEPTLGYPYADGVEGLPQTLTVSITGDPSTPYESGTSLADALGGTMLTVEGEQHTIVATGTNACVDEIASAYLIDLKTPEDDAVCQL